MVQIVGILCKNEHVRIHIRTLRNTTTLTKNTTNHCIFVHIWISLASVRFVLCMSADALCGFPVAFASPHHVELY